MKKTFTKLFATLTFLLVVSTVWAQSITFMVDMTNYLALHPDSISPNGVHITGNFTVPNWTPTTEQYKFTQVGASNIYTLTINRADPLMWVEPTDPDYKFKFINSWNAASTPDPYSWGNCHIDQECLPSGAECTDGGDNRSLGDVGTLPAYDQNFFAPWDSCAGSFLAPLGVHEIPSALATFNVFPNLVTNSAEVSYILLGVSNINVTLLSFTGQAVMTLVDQKQYPGQYKVNLNAVNLANGVYFLQANVDGAITNQRLVVNR